MMLSSKRCLAALLSVFASSAAAHAQDVAEGEGTSAESISEMPNSDNGLLEGVGIALSETLVLHPQGSIESGYQSNVFFQDEDDLQGTIGSALMRISVGGGIATTPPERMAAEAPGGAMAQPKLAFESDLNLTWNQYLSSESTVNRQSDLGANAMVDLTLNPQGVFSFKIRDTFNRVVRPPPVPSAEDADHDRNELLVGTEFRPGGGALKGFATYTFGIDFYERTALDFGNRMSHTFAVGARYQWLPKTQFSLETSFGMVSPSESAVKSASTPLRIVGGISTLLLPRFGVILKGGYGNAFYESGPSFGNYLAQVETRHLLGPTIRASFGYVHDFNDSIFANYYADHAFFGRLGAQFAGRWQLKAKGEIRMRDYAFQNPGMPLEFGATRFCGDAACTSSTRSDLIFRFDTTLDYAVNEWLRAGVEYLFTSDTTDFYVLNLGTDEQDSAAFVWHEMMLKVAARF